MDGGVGRSGCQDVGIRISEEQENGRQDDRREKMDEGRGDLQCGVNRRVNILGQAGQVLGVENRVGRGRIVK